MILLQDKLSIVLVGSFNPAILTPQWIARNALGYEVGQQFQVQMLAPVIGFGAMPQYTFDGITYIPNFQNITFQLANLDNAGRERVASTIATILEQLPHTPIAGIGFNFGFSLPNPNDSVLSLLNASNELAEAFPNGATTVNRNWGNTLTWEESIVSVQAQLDNEVVLIDVNIHHNVTTANDARQIIIAPNSYDKYYQAAISAISGLTSQTLE